MITKFFNIPFPVVLNKSKWPWSDEVDSFVYKERNSWPKISIITPSFNQGKYIEKTIRSILLQNYPNLEYIIIDGGSTDDTVEIIKKYEPWITYWVSEPDKGQSNALNKGFDKATGDIVAWMNSDDYYMKGAFLSVANAFGDPSISVVNGSCQMEFSNSRKSFIDNPGAVTTERMLRFWKDYFCPPQPAIFFKRSVIDEIGGVDESLNYAMDLDLWLRISLKYKFKFIDEVLAGYLIHESSKSGSDEGFIKFFPEWKQVSLKYLPKVSLIKRLKFYFDYAAIKYK